MDTNNNNKAMNGQQRNDFRTVWEYRKKNWREEAEKTMPDDEYLLHLSEIARYKAPLQENEPIPLTRRNNRWIPYAAAASLIIGVTVISLNRQRIADNIPVAQEVNIEGNTMFFICNNGCSAQDVVLAANDVIK